MITVWIPAGAVDLFFLQSSQTSPGIHPAFCSVGIVGSFPLSKAGGALGWLLTSTYCQVLRLCGSIPSFRNMRAFIMWTGISLIHVCTKIAGGPGSSVGIATELRAGQSGDGIPVGARFSARPDRPWGPPSLLYNGYRVFLRGKVRPGHATDHSLPSSAEVLEE
jgi:hypothetical protein